jgi:hypothetical protein
VTAGATTPVAASIGGVAGAPASAATDVVDVDDEAGAMEAAVAIAVAERPIQARTSRTTKTPTQRTAIGAQVEERARA